MKKIKLLYDVNLLINTPKNCIRTGIFFVAYNVLKHLSENPNFDVILYISDNHVWHIQKDFFLSRFKSIKIILNPPQSHQSKKNIKIHKINMAQTSNFFKKIVFILKIIKNYLRFYIIQIIIQIIKLRERKYENIFKSINIFLSPLLAPDDKVAGYKNIIHFSILYDVVPILYPEIYPGFKEGKHWYNKTIDSLNKKSYYFCISKSTRCDFLKLFPDRLDENKMITMPLATAQFFFPEYDTKKIAVTFLKYGINYNANSKYLFSFCSLDPRKNLYFTINCFINFIKKHKISDLYFYLGGVETIPFFDKLEGAVSDFNKYRDKIVFLGYVDDGDVNILYSNALFFTYISQYEGFGMPPLEAMQAGVPVITSNNSSLPEVVGDAAITIDYDSEDQCIKAFEDLYFSEDLRKSYIQKGFERARLFSWEKTAKIISDTILKAMETRSKLD
jgi:glycosyltransferase involved in cell wall biosynthesis